MHVQKFPKPYQLASNCRTMMTVVVIIVVQVLVLPGESGNHGQLAVVHAIEVLEQGYALVLEGMTVLEATLTMNSATLNLVKVLLVEVWSDMAPMIAT